MKPLSLILTAGLVLAGAAVHGAATYRWQALTPNTGRADRLHAQAVEFADYTSEVVPADFEVKEKSAVTCRRYKSGGQGTGAVVSVTTGPPGAVATHAPDVCYPSSGYRTITPTYKDTLPLPGGGEAGCYVAVFEKKSATRAERVKVRWAWAVPGGPWEAPDNPRFRLAYWREPELFKVYVVTPVPAADPAGGTADEAPAGKLFAAAAFGQYAAAGR